MDLEPFSRINPCGYEGLRVTSVLKSGGPANLDEVKPVLVEKLAGQLNARVVFASAEPIPA